MKKRKSYAELEPVKKKENSVWRGFVIIIIMIKTKRKTAKTYIPVSHVFKKKVKEGPDYIYPVWCLVNYHINWEKTFFPLRFTEHALLVTPLANMNESSP